MLIFGMPVLAPVLGDIINACLREGQFPEIWKVAIVKPLPKTPNPSSFSALRPVSILSVLSKILERLVFNMLLEYVMENRLLPSSQSGFRRHFSTCTALLKITTELTLALDSSKVACLALLDYTKAFDVLNHDLLLAKLHFLGLSKLSCNWFENYLRGRSQLVDVGGVRSSIAAVSYGVPQGSILGPILFSLFISDITSAAHHCSLHLYADDTQLVKFIDPLSPTSAINEMNADLSRLGDWSRRHGLMLNASKSCLLFVGTPYMRAKMRFNTFVTVHIDGVEIPEKDCARNLGVLLDNNLSFEQHVASRVSYVYMKLKSLYRYKYLLDVSLKYRIVESLVFPMFEYCLPVYFNFLTVEYASKVQLAQNSCIRFAYSIRKYDRISHIYNNNGHLKVFYRHKFHLGTLLKGIFDTKEPSYLYEMFQLRSHMHNLHLRGANFDMMPHRTAKFQSCFAYAAVKMLNDSDTYFMICNTSSLVFRKRFKTLLLAEQILES